MQASQVKAEAEAVGIGNIMRNVDAFDEQLQASVKQIVGVRLWAEHKAQRCAASVAIGR